MLKSSNIGIIILYPYCFINPYRIYVNIPAVKISHLHILLKILAITFHILPICITINHTQLEVSIIPLNMFFWHFNIEHLTFYQNLSIFNFVGQILFFKFLIIFWDIKPINRCTTIYSSMSAQLLSKCIVYAHIPLINIKICHRPQHHHFYNF